MKKFWLYACLTLNCTFSLLATDIALDFSDYGTESLVRDSNSETFYHQPGEQKSYPYNFNVYFDSISDAKIDRGYYKGDKVRYKAVEAELGMVFYNRPTYSEAANVAISYTETYLHWSENPWFDQDRFHTLSFSVGGVTKRLRNWFWRSQLDINYDTTGSSVNSQYLYYDLLLWGRYEYSQNFGFHIGFIGQTGMGLDKVYPILGADWQMSRNWKLNLVFPVNVSLEYTLNNQWSLAIAGRNFDIRHRVKKDESYGKSLIRYQNIGAEFAVKYNTDFLTANLHAGTTLGGKYRISNHNNHHPHHYNLRPSGYFGGEVDIKF
ncbi:DUF6268 family outer membrane beta-barrel protein [Candidatus Protochlamydia amoebophila]|uniref:DUF6268 domain-containing protein n=1 Tax=Candidatus Protochlamydia amoebophila TaxID=362787 RepID=A0A0C1H5M7_9BACT|nr:DUF6268 family outer membrane beta-barrel protein [Candidatus Protochlamydia amoebophila]KIC72789.1 hypothetical protein DB44_CA00010 [Candidatus Protochlamydia amoebophila]